MSDHAFTVREVTQETWADFEQLFEARGGPKYCWCMLWRKMPPDVEKTNETRKQTIRTTVEAGTPIGLLGYRDGAPVAWCSVAPRGTYRKLGGPPDREDTPNAVWSLTCFYVKRALRTQGIANRMLEAAIKHVRDRGGDILEAYPVAPDSPSYRFMGVIPRFEKAGFAEIGRTGARRHIMRLELK